MKEFVGDVSMRRVTTNRGVAETMQLTVPSKLGRSVLSAGYNRAKVYLTDEGILYVPYITEETDNRLRVALPNFTANEEAT